MNSKVEQTEPDEVEKTILLVDDEENIIRSLVRLLRRDGYKILTAIGGKAGLEVLKENKVGVILSDQRMPEMSGVEFLSQVKELYPDTVRMVLSGYTDLNSVTDAINHGAVYKFLTKPWEDDLLRANIEDAFKRFRVYRENKRLELELVKLNEKLENRVKQQNRESEINLRMLQFSHKVMDSLPVAVLGISEENMIAMANNRAHEVFKMHPGSLLANDAAQTLPETLQASYQALNLIQTEDEVSSNAIIYDINYHVIAKKMFGEAGVRGMIITLIKAEFD